MSKRKAKVFDEAINALISTRAVALECQKKGVSVECLTAIRCLKILDGARVQRFGRMGNGLDIESDGKLAALLVRARKLRDRIDVKNHTKEK